MTCYQFQGVDLDLRVQPQENDDHPVRPRPCQCGHPHLQRRLDSFERRSKAHSRRLTRNWKWSWWMTAPRTERRKSASDSKKESATSTRRMTERWVLARARAILKSRGEWVALLDHDDRWLSTKIEEQVAEIQCDKRTGIVFTGAHIIDEDGLRGEEIPKGPSGDVFHQLLAGARYCCTSSALIRRSAIDFARRQGPEGDFLVNPKPSNSDIDLWLRISRFSYVVFLDKPLTEYRVHRSNTSHNTAWLVALQLQALEATETNLHDGCSQCLKCLHSGRRRLQRMLALAHFDKFISHTVRGEKSLDSLADAFRADFRFILNARRFGVMVKYLFRNAVFRRASGPGDGPQPERPPCPRSRG